MNLTFYRIIENDVFNSSQGLMLKHSNTKQQAGEIKGPPCPSPYTTHLKTSIRDTKHSSSAYWINKCTVKSWSQSIVVSKSHICYHVQLWRSSETLPNHINIYKDSLPCQWRGHYACADTFSVGLGCWMLTLLPKPLTSEPRLSMTQSCYESSEIKLYWAHLWLSAPLLYSNWSPMNLLSGIRAMTQHLLSAHSSTPLPQSLVTASLISYFLGQL